MKSARDLNQTEINMRIRAAAQGVTLGAFELVSIFIRAWLIVYFGKAL
jgi:hypothetical protein